MATGGGGDPRMRFVIEADNRASAEMERATADARALGGAARQAGQEYSRLSDEDLAKASAQFDLLYGTGTKAATATKDLGEAANLGALGIGRIRNELGTLTGRLTGTNTAIDRVAGALGGFAVGDPVMIAVLAGISALSLVWDSLGTKSDELADRLDKNMKRMRQSSIDAQLAVGDLQVARATTDQAAAARAVRDAIPVYDAKTGLQTNGSDIEALKRKLQEANADLAQWQANKAQLDYQTRNAADRNAAEQLAILVRSNNATHAERQRALALLKQDQAEVDALGTSQTDNVRRLALIRDVNTLDSALNPKGTSRAADSLAAARLRLTETDARRASDEFARSLPRFTTATDVYDEQQKNGPMRARGVAEGARREAAGSAAEDPATKALLKAYNDRNAAVAKANKAYLDAEKKHWLAVESVVMGSVDALVRGQISLGRAVLQAALAPEIMHLQALAAKHMALAAADFATGNVIGGAKETAGAAALTAGASLLAMFAQGSGGSGGGFGGGGGGGGGFGGGVGTFRPDSAGTDAGNVTIQLITKHPSSPDVVDSIVYQINRGNVLKRPPIPIPPTSGIQTPGAP